MSRFPMRTFQQDAILKRLSDGLVALEVSNVKQLTTEQCNKLQCGDVVVKVDSSGEHAYVVTFKSDSGMCLTYTDASVVETQSYDLVDDAWVYNSEDKTPNLLDAQTENDVVNLLGSGDVPSVKADEIIENMSGYSVELGVDSQNEFTPIYIGACKNGNKITFVVFGKITKLADSVVQPTLVTFTIPNDVGAKLYPYSIGGVNRLDIKDVNAYYNTAQHYNFNAQIIKLSNTQVKIDFEWGNLVQDVETTARIEVTFLLNDNLIPQS